MVTFDDLRLSEATTIGLERFGITSPCELSLLAAYLIESPIGDAVDATYAHVDDVLAGLCIDLYHSHVTPEVPALYTSAEYGDNTVSYYLTLIAANLRLKSSLIVPIENVTSVLSGEYPLHDLDFQFDCSYDSDPFAHLYTEIDSLNQRLRDVITLRFGLDGTPATSLEGVGKRLDVTRERARQIEAQALYKLSEHRHRSQLAWPSAVALSYAQRLHTRPDDALVADAIEQDIPTVRCPILPWLKLLAAVQGKQWAQQTDRQLGPLRSPVVTTVTKAIVALLSRYGTMPFEELQARVARECTLPNDSDLTLYMRLSNAFIMGGDETCRLPDEPIPGIRDKQLRRLNAMIGVLERDGPSHFTHVMSEINSRLIPSFVMSERDTHAWLGRFPDLFVWAGQGTYALQNAGAGIRAENLDGGAAELPEQYRKRRRKGIGDEIAAVLLECGPLTLEEIETHVLKRFSVNLTSVEAAILQDAAARFVAKEDGRIALRQEGEGPPDRTPQRVKIMEGVIASLIPRAKELCDSVRHDAENGFARSNGSTLFNHAVVAAILGLDREWTLLNQAPAHTEIPSEAWNAAAALRSPVKKDKNGYE